MTTESDSHRSSTTVPIIIWAAVLTIAFLYYRTSDLGELGTLFPNLFAGKVFGATGFGNTVIGIVISLTILMGWYGLGFAISTGLDKAFGATADENRSVSISKRLAFGAAIWSMVFFAIGVLGLYRSWIGVTTLIIGLGLFANSLRDGVPSKAGNHEKTNYTKNLAFGLIGIALVIAAIGASAPPTAKDTLLYHFAVPKYFIINGKLAPIEGNIASFLALGTEMHVVWAMLIGNLVSFRVSEIAAGITVFAFFPILIFTTIGWSREIGLNRNWSAIAGVTVAAIPVAFHVASSAYIDLALALYVSLALRAVTRWWKSGNNLELAQLAIFLGAALSIKLTAMFSVVTIALIILLRARSSEERTGGVEEKISTDEEIQDSRKISSSQLLSRGFLSLMVAAIIASPWYIRSWVNTGSPVFPFYMNIWKGAATGWDIERSGLFQLMNSRYGGGAQGLVGNLLSPFHLAFIAQPDKPEFFDGVLGPAFLFGLPLVFLVWRRKQIPIELKLGMLFAGILFLFWVFTSQQLRYLLPIFPVLAISICFSAYQLSSKNHDNNSPIAWILVLFGLCGVLVSLSWFAALSPVQVVLGGQTRDQYLTRNLDYYSYYLLLNKQLPADGRVWLINMRRDTYNLDRPYFSDYLFEDWTLKQLAENSKSAAEMRSKASAMGITFLLSRHDVLLDYSRSVIFSEKRDEVSNREKIQMVSEFLLEGNVIAKDSKFSLVRIDR